MLRDPNNNAPLAPASPGAFIDFEIDGITDCLGSTYTNETGGNAEEPCVDGDDVPESGDDLRATPDMTCSITPGSTVTGFPAGTACQVSYTRTDPGTDFIAGWVDEGNNAADESDPTETPGAGTGERNPAETGPITFTDPGAAPGGGDEGDEPEPDDTDVVEKNWQTTAATFLDCDEEPVNTANNLRGQNSADNEVNQTNETETYRCTVFNQFGGTFNGAQVAGETITPVNDAPPPPGGDDGNTPNSPDHAVQTCNPTCDFVISAIDNETGNQDICFFIVGQGEPACGAENFGDADFQAGPNNEQMDETNQGGTNAPQRASDTVRKQWVSATARSVDAEPEDDTNATGDQHTITARTFTQVGDPGQAGFAVHFEWLQGPGDPTPGGPDNTPDATCVTDTPPQAGTNQCSISYTSANPGIDVVCVYTGNTAPVFDPDPNPEAAQCGAEAGNQAEPAPTVGDEGFQFQGGTQGAQDVVIKRWVAQNQAAATQIDAAPDTDTNNVGQRHDIYVIARDAQGNPTFGQTTQQTATTNCQLATNSPNANPAGAGATGPCPTRVRADIQVGSPNNSGVVVVDIQCASTGQSLTTDPIAPGSTPEAGNATHVCSYVGQNPGQDQIRVFYDTNDDGQFTQGEPNEIVRKTWAGAATQIQVTPPNDEAPVGVCNTFTVLVRDAAGNPVAGTVDVRQTFRSPPAAGQPNQPNITFCSPPAGTGPNPRDPNNQNPAANTESAPGALPGGGLGPNAGGTPNTRHAEFTTDNTGQVTFGIASTQPGIVDLQIWVDRENPDNDAFNPENNEPGITATKTWTPGGQTAARNLTATPTSDTNPVNTVHRITATVTNQAGQGLQGVNVSMQFSQNSANNPGQIVPCQNPTNQNGVVTCQYTGTIQGSDSIVVFVNQGGSAGPDSGEPQQPVTKNWTAAPQGLTVDLTCAGTVAGGTNRPPQQGETPNQAATRRETCVNPLTDSDEVFTALVRDAANQPRAGVRVNFTVTAVNSGQTTNNVGSAQDVSFTGGSGTGTQSVAECDTAANGTCSVTLTNPNPQNNDQVTVLATVAGQAAGAGTTDDATKTWQTPVASNLVLTPRAATNQVNTQHTVTATIQSQFGETLTTNPGVTVDFRIFAGPNNGLSQLDTPLTNGVATFTFTSPIAGLDRILACAETTAQGGGGDNDVCNQGQANVPPNNAPAGGGGNPPAEPFGEASKTWQTGAVTSGAVVLDMDAEDPGTGQGATPPGACEVATPTDPTRERTATNTINPTNATAADNFHTICARAFQGQGGNQGGLSGAPITFTITGVGRISAATPQGTCPTNVVPAAGTTVTVTANEQGTAFACLYSQQVGRTNVTASAGTPAVSDTGTKDWTVGTERARNIQLCHGDVAGTTCETDAQTNEPGDDHQLTARVTDVQGNPVAGVPVQFRETGPAIFTPQGGSTATVNTDANGLASVIMTSDVEGTSTVVAEILAGAGVNNTRGPGATDDQCEQPAGQGGTPAAGNCVSQTLTKNWTTTPPVFECDDNIDNDSDGNVDFPEDLGCESDQDDSELPVDPPPPPERVPHERRVSIRFQDGTGARNNGLVVFGRLRLAGDGTNPDCIRQVPINVQRRVNGRWVTKKATTTNRRGRYAVEIFDLASRYRAVAVRHTFVDEDLNQKHVCLRAVKEKRHRHRR